MKRFREGAMPKSGCPQVNVERRRFSALHFQLLKGRVGVLKEGTTEGL